jgi:hypothetical protein
VPFWYVDLVTSPDTPRAPRSCRVAVSGSRGLMRLSVTPRRTTTGRRRFRFRTTSGGRPVAGATVRFRGRQVLTNRRGRARIVARIGRPGRYRARATRSGMRRATARVRVTRRSLPSFAG